MASDSSSTYEKRWVRQGLSSIEAKIEVEATPSIFQVTKELKETLGEAYTPQKLGLGAYHHLSPRLHVADRQKHALIRELIDHNHLPNFSLDNFLEEMKDLEPVIRSNYDNYLDLEPPTLAYIMAIDSLYLLAFLQSYHQNSVHKTFAADILKLENQIPAAALNLAGNQLGLFLDNNGDTKLYAEFFYDFCRAHSPLKLADLRENLKSKHLLAHLYYLIVNNQGLKDDGDKAMPVFLPLKYPESVIFFPEDSPTIINSSIDASLDSNCSAVAAVEITPTMNERDAGSFDGPEAVIKPYHGRQLNQGLKDEDEDDDNKAAMPEFLSLNNPDSVIVVTEDSSMVINSSIDASLDSNCSAVAAVEIAPMMNQGVAIPLTSEKEMDAGSFDGAEAVIKPYRGRQLNQGLKDEDEDDDDKAAMPEFLQLKNPDSVIVVTEDSYMLIKSSIDASLDSTPTESLGFAFGVITLFQAVTTIFQVCKSSSFANYIFKQEEEKKKKAKIEEIQIPSASELSKKFNVDFKPARGGIRDIKFQTAEELGGGEAKTLYLPEIKLESGSEVVLRNLVAYEAALFAAHSPGSKLELTDYVDLMCGIVETTEDVKLLRNNGIVEGDLSDEKIAEMFNGINRSTAGTEQSEEEKSESQKAVEEVNKMVEELESKMMWKRACKFCNKIVKSTKELLVKKPAIIAMKYLTSIFLAALLILQILQAYCDIYDCSRKESQTTNVAARLMSVI